MGAREGYGDGCEKTKNKRGSTQHTSESLVEDPYELDIGQTWDKCCENRAWANNVLSDKEITGHQKKSQPKDVEA